MNKFKKDDEVYCLKYGKGIVTEIRSDSIFPVVCSFSIKTYERYDQAGFLNNNCVTPFLYHIKPRIIEVGLNKETFAYSEALDKAKLKKDYMRNTAHLQILWASLTRNEAIRIVRGNLDVLNWFDNNGVPK